MHALVVDDSDVIRKILTAYLQKLGFEVTAAINGREALEQLHRMERADVALVDWNMPEMDGIAFLREVRADVQYDSLPVMMVTAYGDGDRRRRARELGAIEFITKPVDFDRLKEQLRQLPAAAA